MIETLLQLLLLSIAVLILIIVILKNPLIGLGLSIATTPITEILPDVPMIGSVLPFLGLLTLVAFLIMRKRQKQVNLNKVEILCLLWVIWASISNPQASILGSNRVWLFSLIQLWILMLLSRRLVITEKDHITIMTIIVFMCLISASTIFIFNENAPKGFQLANRADGLSGGANTAARYFTYAIILLIYLQGKKRYHVGFRAIMVAGIVLLLLALFYTESRTGLFILIVVGVLFSFRFLRGWNKSLIPLAVIILWSIWFLNQVRGTVLEPSLILKSALTGSDTVGARYDLWETGWYVWLDHPIAGVGIGEFYKYITEYWHSSKNIVATSLHNTYMQLLVETGIIGFILFFNAFLMVIRNLWKKAKSSKGTLKEVSWVWLVVLIAMMIGAITKTETTDKLLWFLLAIGAQS